MKEWTKDSRAQRELPISNGMCKAFRLVNAKIKAAIDAIGLFTRRLQESKEYRA